MKTEAEEAYECRKTSLLRAIALYAQEDTAVAFSGGVDSSLLLKLVCEASGKHGTKTYALTADTALHPTGDLKAAGSAAAAAGAIALAIHLDELEAAGIQNNPTDRCYLCKKYIFSELKKQAEALGVSVIMEGTNEDDLHVYRPGIRAVRELGITSPLADAGMTKADVRRLAAELGLEAAARPSAPCLATRFPYGTELSYEWMRKIEQGEERLRSYGLYNVRLRLHGDIVRIETDISGMPALLQNREEILAYLQKIGFIYITLDLEGFRSGSMDYKLIKQ